MTTTKETRTCPGCGTAFARKSSRGPWPRTCDECKGQGPPEVKTRGPRVRQPSANGTGGGPTAEADGLDVWDAIAEWELSFPEGSAVTWIYNASCEDDADAKLEAYREARSFLDHAIKRLEG